jgi:phage FluMu protein Com
MRAPEPRKECESTSISKDHAALRCCCGSLLARLVTGGVELKCRRCKRRVVVSLNHTVPVRITM